MNNKVKNMILNQTLVFDIERASKLIGLSVSFLRKAIKEKKLTAKKIGNKFLIHNEELHRFSREVTDFDAIKDIQISSGGHNVALLQKWVSDTHNYTGV